MSFEKRFKITVCDTETDTKDCFETNKFRLKTDFMTFKDTFYKKSGGNAKMKKGNYAVYFNAEKHGTAPEIREYVDELKSFYEFIGCETVDIVRRQIGGRTYHIICDDTGLFKEKPILSATDIMFNPELVGNLIITGESDIEGDLHGVTLDEAKYILSNFFRIAERYVLILS